MLTQEELNKEYVDGPAAAKMLNVTSNQIRFLCSKGRLKGAIKLGTSGWIIPRISVLNYKPQKRGPKPRTPKEDDDKTVWVKALNEANKWKEGNSNDQQ